MFFSATSQFDPHKMPIRYANLDPLGLFPTRCEYEWVGEWEFGKKGRYMGQKYISVLIGVVFGWFWVGRSSERDSYIISSFLYGGGEGGGMV
jgi:hypothetical protein